MREQILDKVSSKVRLYQGLLKQFTGHDQHTPPTRVKLVTNPFLYKGSMRSPKRRQKGGFEIFQKMGSCQKMII